MASKSAQNGLSLDTNVVTIYDPGTSGTCIAFSITNRATSSGNVLVNVAGLHAAGEYRGLPPGLDKAFINASGGIGIVTAKSDSTATVDCGIDRK